MPRPTSLLLLLLTGLTAGPAWPAAAELYTGSVPVESQSAGASESALPAALQHVLRKLSGLREFENPAEISAAVADARAMVISFHYRNDKLLQGDGTLLDRLQLVARFNPAAVDQLMVTLRLPRWQAERKPVTVWFIVDDGSNRRIRPVELEYALQGMLRAADDRAMPYVLPEPDENGEFAADVQLLWGGYTEESPDETPGNTLVVAARREGPEWNVRLNLSYEGLSWSQRSRAIELQDALVEGMQLAVDAIVSSHSIAAQDLGSSVERIRVTGLGDSTDYARCLTYLEHLSLVERVEVMAAAPGQVDFEIVLKALPHYFAAALAADGILVASADERVYVLAPEAPAEAMPAPGRDGPEDSPAHD